LTGRRTTR